MSKDDESEDPTAVVSFVNPTFDCAYFSQDSRTLTVGGMIVGIRQHDLFAGHPLVIDDDRRFKIHSRLQRILRNHRDDQLNNVFVPLEFQAMQILKRERGDVGSPNV